MPIELVDLVDDPRVADYRNVPDPVLLRERGLFVAEGRLVVEHLLASTTFRAASVLLSPPALDRMREALSPHDELPVYVMPLDVLSKLVGFHIHRGCLAIGTRPVPRAADDWVAAVEGAPLLLALEHVANADNIGGIFRNALAFGAGGVLLSPDCCDPLYRKAIRVSIGASLCIPFATAGSWPGDLQSLKRAGYHLLALTPAPGARDLEEALQARPQTSRVALMVGHEGTGLSDDALLAADDCVRISMAEGVDSLNVATAAGVAMYACTHRRLSGRPSVW